MANSDITINRIPLKSIGVTLLAGAYSALLTPPPLKDFVKNDDPTKPGTDVLVNNPVVSERDVTLTFLIEGADQHSFLSNYKAFISELQKGKVVLYIPDLNWYFHLLYSNSTQFENYRLNACKIAVKFNEPNPANRITEGAGPLITSDDLTFVTSDGDIFYLSEQYKMKYLGGEMDNRLTDIKTLCRRKKDKTIYENISGSTAVLDVKAGHDYTYGTLASLTIKSVEDSSIGAFIRFVSGSTKTTLVWPDSLQKIGYWKPAPNMAYEISIKNNIAIIQEFNTQTNSKTMVTRSTYPAKSQPIPTLLSAVSADEEATAGQYNSIYSGSEIDKLLTDAEQIPNKEDKPVVENISAADPTLNVVGGHEYICGTLTSLTIQSVDGSSKESSIKFTSGDSATQFAWPDSLDMIGNTVIKSNATYEISIKGNKGIIVYAE